MLPFKDFKKNIEKWKLEKDFGKIIVSATKRLEAQGFVRLVDGSFCTWIHKDWFDTAKIRGVVRKNAYGQYVPVAKVIKSEKEIGRKGRMAITETTEILDYSDFRKFMEEYNSFLASHDAQDAYMDDLAEGGEE